MIAVSNQHEVSQPTWQNEFVEILPEIERRLRLAFCRLGDEAREEAIEEGIVHSLLTYIRLFAQGRAESVGASTLAWYAAKQVRRGRPAAVRMNGREPLSRYAQIGKGIQVEQLHGRWIDLLVEDKRASVPDQVAAKMDVGAWFVTLTDRMRQIAKDLAFGCSTSEVAKKHGLTVGRISQLRRSMGASWAAFQQESVPTLT